MPRGVKANLSGRTFERLTVISPLRGRSRAFWLCECSCGKPVAVRGDYLLNGATRSCGCLRKDLLEKYNKQRWAAHVDH